MPRSHSFFRVAAAFLVAFAGDVDRPAAKEEPVELDLGALFARSGKRWY